MAQAAAWTNALQAGLGAYVYERPAACGRPGGEQGRQTGCEGVKRRRRASVVEAAVVEETGAVAAGVGTGGGDIAADSTAADSRGVHRGAAPDGSSCRTRSSAPVNAPAAAGNSGRPAAEWQVACEVLASWVRRGLVPHSQRWPVKDLATDL